ncbi:MAG: 50S ribosomal protein L4 [Candidatus Moranbacteria bacterium RBG_13_45_13]|nr:MAG: 50S ribosomal protein L4 [Candidatus Moranbacteria bacterium RBG_13_45_13]
MIKFPVYNLKGEKVKDIELSEKVFGAKKNDALLHQVYVSQYANRRRVLAHTKDRAERAGSGRKPWQQKGTGRARVGSVRSPIWRKGGIVFGPTKDRNFKKDVPKKMGQRALAVALSGKTAEKELCLVDSLVMKEAKSKMMSDAINNLKIKGSVLVGFSEKERDTKRASRNLAKVSNIEAKNLNVFDVLNNKYLLISEEGIKIIQEKYNKK